MNVLAFDTSNYTTSCAAFDGISGQNCSRLLDVAQGQLGLRQSDALFMHVKRLPELAAELFASFSGEIAAVGASSQPREVEGSYMPCFLAGLSQARVLASAMGVPMLTFSHQMGHIAAAAWSAGREELMDGQMLAWHLSGGTTELLLVRPKGSKFTCSVIGGTSDISAGQLIDRTAKLLDLGFPGGKALDALAVDAKGFEVKLKGLSFSLSGMENKAAQLVQRGAPSPEVAGFVLSTIASVVERAGREAMKEYGNLPLLFTGGVASNSMLRRRIQEGIFPKPQYATDNAMGVAILTHRAMSRGEAPALNQTGDI